eukprot:m.255121 g.255121  ORF g.255121 m.255121 type:complete len:464 (-) comp19299_c0_seq1:222-1613(-)
MWPAQACWSVTGNFPGKLSCGFDRNRFRPPFTTSALNDAMRAPTHPCIARPAAQPACGRAHLSGTPEMIRPLLASRCVGVDLSPTNTGTCLGQGMGVPPAGQRPGHNKSPHSRASCTMEADGAVAVVPCAPADSFSAWDYDPALEWVWRDVDLLAPCEPAPPSPPAPYTPLPLDMASPGITPLEADYLGESMRNTPSFSSTFSSPQCQDRFVFPPVCAAPPHSPLCLPAAYMPLPSPLAHASASTPAHANSPDGNSGTPCSSYDPSSSGTPPSRPVSRPRANSRRLPLAASPGPSSRSPRPPPLRPFMRDDAGNYHRKRVSEMSSEELERFRAFNRVVGARQREKCKAAMDHLVRRLRELDVERDELNGELVKHTTRIRELRGAIAERLAWGDPALRTALIDICPTLFQGDASPTVADADAPSPAMGSAALSLSPPLLPPLVPDVLPLMDDMVVDLPSPDASF